MEDGGAWQADGGRTTRISHSVLFITGNWLLPLINLTLEVT